jgi:hypothetical protein
VAILLAAFVLRSDPPVREREHERAPAGRELEPEPA